jgi:hypothetical protein
VPASVRIVPLGGLGEVGMNCLAVEAEGRIAVVDCGVLFTDEPFGVDVLVPDLTWLLERRAQVARSSSPTVTRITSGPSPSCCATSRSRSSAPASRWPW